MKISLKSYHDLGKCSFGTLMDEFDTDVEKIFIHLDGQHVEVKISKVEDLFPFLWAHCGASCGHNHYFGTNPSPWWKHQYTEIIKSATEHCEKVLKKLKKPNLSIKLLKKYRDELSFWNPQKWLTYDEHYDKQREQLEKDLIEDNKNVV